jgi:hypothetical protein
MANRRRPQYRLKPIPADPALTDALTSLAPLARDDRRRTSVTFRLATPWHGAGRSDTLTATFERADGRLRAFVAPGAAVPPAGLTLESAADRARAAVVDWHAPLRLATARVAKPWGAEHWYTGVEARGVSAVTDGRHTTPLPWVLALDPDHFQGCAPLLLGKLLEPSHEPVRGDLYFELHERKEEVYVVTAVDERVWPDGVGAIRFGMNAACRAAYADDDRFRADYLCAVQRYEAARRRIDAGDPDCSLPRQERDQRAAMDAFTALRDLRRGDVVHVPPGFPHALQHGVRAIELQTPDFERRILSFAQATPTQAHWDTATAVQGMTLDARPLARIEDVPAPTGVRVERIARCAAFETVRVTLAAGARHRLATAFGHRLCIALDDGAVVCGAGLEREQACLAPAALPAIDLAAPAQHPASVVVAVPHA